MLCMWRCRYWNIPNCCERMLFYLTCMDHLVVNGTRSNWGRESKSIRDYSTITIGSMSPKGPYIKLTAAQRLWLEKKWQNMHNGSPSISFRIATAWLSWALPISHSQTSSSSSDGFSQVHYSVESLYIITGSTILVNGFTHVPARGC